jgi:iron complex transport system permease protein
VRPQGGEAEQTATTEAGSGEHARGGGSSGRSDGAMTGLVPPRFRSAAMVLLVAGVIGVAGVSVFVGSVWVSPSTVLRVLGAEFGLADRGDLDPAVAKVVWDLRLPRVLLGVVVGAGLAVAGGAIQVAVRNPLGDPYLLGVMAGASTGAVFVIVLGTGTTGGLGVSAAAFVGAAAATTMTFLFGRAGARLPPVRVVLAGVAVAYLFSSVTFYLQTLANPNELRRALFWGLGSLGGATWADLWIPSIAVVVGVVWLVTQARSLNALLTGHESATSLGVNVERQQLVLLFTASALSAVVVAVAGGIGFVGLVVPHVARMLLGSDHRRSLPAMVLLGALFMMLADLVARTIVRPAELPIGVVTSAVGAPFFLWLLRRVRTGA